MATAACIAVNPAHARPPDAYIHSTCFPYPTLLRYPALFPPCLPVQERVALLDPEVRCFSDTPAWLEANQHRLANRRILMYCTGGVRWVGRRAVHSCPQLQCGGTSGQQRCTHSSRCMPACWPGTVPVPPIPVASVSVPLHWVSSCAAGVSVRLLT